VALDKITPHLWGIIRRWKWIAIAIFMSLLMTYVMYWMDVEETVAFGILPAFMSYTTLALFFFMIIAGIVYELKAKFKIFYLCQNCYQNFVIDGHMHTDVRCPYCSSKNLSVITTVANIKEHPRGLVWNPKEEDDLSPPSADEERQRRTKVCSRCGSQEHYASAICSKCSHPFEKSTDNEGAATAND